jgi:hypothetical protein
MTFNHFSSDTPDLTGSYTTLLDATIGGSAPYGSADR